MDSRYTTKELVHINRDTGVSVFKATLPSGLSICVKEQYVKERNSRLLQKSLAAQQRLTHGNICPVLRIEVSSGEDACVYGELAWMDSSLDYHSLILQKARKSWSLQHSFLMLDHLSSALALGQSLGQSHGALFPSNIYYLPQGPCFLLSNYKVEAPTKEDKHADIVFLSPLQRQEYALQVLGTPSKLSQDQYKSDVFALGVVLLYMNRYQEVMKSQGQITRLYEIINMCSYSLAVKTLIREMLAIEESQRPDCISLRTKVREIIETSLLKSVNSLINRDCLGIREPLSQLLLCSVSLIASYQYTESPMRICSQCSRSFQLEPTEPWRLYLWGSYLAKPSKSLCSQACLPASPSSITPPSTRECKVIYSIIKSAAVRLYFNCLLHSATESQLKTYYKSIRPGFLPQCPICPEAHMLNYTIAGYSFLYPEHYTGFLAFAVVKISRVIVLSKCIKLQLQGEQYLVCPWLLLEFLNKGKCHWCGGALQSDWRPCIHAQQPFLSCSQACANARISPSCSTCQQAILPDRVTLARGELRGCEAFFKSADSTSCCLCGCGVGEVTGDCEHSFCSSCMEISAHLKPKGEIVCLFCGSGSGLSAN